MDYARTALKLREQILKFLGKLLLIFLLYLTSINVLSNIKKHSTSKSGKGGLL